MEKEIALADIPTMAAAINAGVNRVELNANLEVGGLTPDPDTVVKAVQLAAKSDIDLVVMIRPELVISIITMMKLKQCGNLS